MFDRVVAALVVVMLMLFNASTALASGECHHDTAQCLVSLDLQAEEVLSTDLEVVSSLDLEYIREAEPRDSECTLVENLTSAVEEATALGAAGVQYGTPDLSNSVALGCQHHEARARNLEVGGAGA